jgi:enoyl-CoA hydratase/carnithine racemase
VTTSSPVKLETITIDDSVSVATLTIGTGQRFNALGQQEWEALERAATSLADHERLRAVGIVSRIHI